MSYKYGINLTGQQKPVFWDNYGTLNWIYVQNPSNFNNIFYDIGYDENEYVAQDNNTIASEYTNTQCSCTNVVYPWDNDKFLDKQFWASLPTEKPYCHIIAALYGSNTAGTDRTAYTQFWDSWTGRCNVENVEVIYTGQVPEALANNTIYVVSGSTQNIATPRNMASCSAILGI
jgi:hypothetical protein